MLNVDLNCDMGEGFDSDAVIMPFISSANIACGYHAGNRDIMRRTVDLAVRNNVAVGAHPSYPDRKNFGRIDIFDTLVKPQDLLGILVDQIEQLASICAEFDVHLHHVKPHGALYNRAARDREVSWIICEAMQRSGQILILYGLSGSKMKTAADSFKIPFANEVFADRTYHDDGSLSPRSEPNALVMKAEDAAKQALDAVKNKSVRSIHGKQIPVAAETICIHGDSEHAASFAEAIHQYLQTNGVIINRV